MKTSPGPAPTRSTARSTLAVAGLLGAVLALTSCTAPGGPGTPGTTPAPGSSTAGTGGAGPGQTPEPEPSELELALAGPSMDTEEAAAAAVAQMDTAERAGQVLVGELGAPGTDPDSIRSLHLGGVILMGDAVPTAADGTADLEALATKIELTQEALSEGRDWSGVVGVDQEGGLVARVKAPLVEWPTPMSYGAVSAGGGTGPGGDSGGGSDAEELTRAGFRAMGQELAELGFTLDFAPSVDVTIGAQDPAIGARSFSSDPDQVAVLGREATAGLMGAGVIPTPKHFPGHGSVTADSHVTAPVQEATVAELEARDWLPFTALLAGEVEGLDVDPVYTPAVMMGHLVVPALEPEVPSSVSAAAYEALRGLALPDGSDGADSSAAGGVYNGVVVTDALNMGALVERYGADEAPVKALAAGADLLLMPSDLVGAHGAIVAAVEDGTVPAERLTEAAERVVTLMMWRDHLAETLQAATDEEKAAAGVVPSADAAEVSRRVSAEAVTVVQGECGAPLVTDALQIAGGNATDRARLAAAAEGAGLTVGSGPVVRLLGGAHESGGGDVVVALDGPFGLPGSTVPDDGAKVALYGRTPGAFEALVDVLTGEAEAPGALPVDVGQWPVGTGCD